MDLDDATNGILLDKDTLHMNRHDNYSNAWRRALDDIPDDLPLESKMERVYGIQANATEKLVEGNSLRRELIAEEDEWYEWLSRRFSEFE